MVSGFNSSQDGEITLTVEYEGKNVQFTVTVEKEDEIIKPRPLCGNITLGGPTMGSLLTVLLLALLSVLFKPSRQKKELNV